MREWAEQAKILHRYIAVCSDTKVGRNDEDASLSELEITPTTDPKNITKVLKKNKGHMLVVFSTYQSIMQVSQAQKSSKIEFDLVVCDEAHRTTGIVQHEQETRSTRISDSDKISGFTAIHSQENIRAKKRLYTTATPKIYATATREKAEEGYGVETYSMDDEIIYGPEFYKLTFDDAINQNLLSDYKVVVMSVEEDNVSRITQQAADRGDELNIPKVAQWIGCWKGLRNPDKNSPRERGNPLQKAIAFTQDIANSKRFAHSFPGITEQVTKNHESVCATEHVDGTQNALNRREKLNWLEESDSDSNECRVLSNARCLSEGIDVPALDAVIFLNPRESIIDVIQAVGRIMRKAEGKNYGYVILPVAVSAKSDPEKILNDNEKYRVVWNVLRALRAHDSKRFEQRLIDGDILSDIIIWNQPEPCPDCHAGVCDTHRPRPKCQHCEMEFGGGTRCEKHSPDPIINIPEHLIHSKIVDKVSDRRYLENWAKDISEIVSRVTIRITTLKNTNAQISDELDAFYSGIRRMINDSIAEDEAMNMLAQHVVMGRVFDALFHNEFTKNNPVAITMNRVIESLRRMGLDAEMEKLEGFYADIEDKVRSIDTHKGRQTVIRELYDKFFKHAFEKTAKRLGVVYTPIEVVDFILLSTDHLLKEHFGTGFTDKNVNVIDPFVGTGSFLARLMSKDLNLIKDEDLKHKYQNTLHTSEIILLAYYIASVNCESTFTERSGKYLPFKGAVFVDTFHSKDLTEEWNEGLFTEAQKRIERQRKTQITAIVTNPPYSVGQKDHDDQNPNIRYPDLDKNIENTYLKKSTVSNKKSLYDSYIRSIRLMSDRIGASGVIGFVINASFLRSDATSGVRACLVEEFNEIWCLDLRGNQRTKGEMSKREGGKIFGSGSRAPIAITILVKNAKKKGCTIHYKDIGDCLNQEQKLEIIRNAKFTKGISGWKKITPDKHHDWLNKRKDDFTKYTAIGNEDTKKGKKINAIFRFYSRGIATSRDDWAYNSSKNNLAYNMKRHIDYCNSQNLDSPEIDSKQAKWTKSLPKRIRKNKPKFDKGKIRMSLYRPFFKQWLYSDKTFNHEFAVTPKLFPKPESENLVIAIPYKFTGEFSVFMTDIISDLEVVHHGQCFPFYTYETDGTKKENITDSTLEEYREHHNDKKITKHDIFYYVYSMLHHPVYKIKFANNLSREFPHIPLAPNFKAFKDIGRKLAKLHLNFETCNEYDLGKPEFDLKEFKKLDFVTKDVCKDDMKNISNERFVIKADKRVLFKNIPYVKYSVNGYNPVEWIADRYQITTKKKNGITNDPCSGTNIVKIIRQAVYLGKKSDELISKLPKEFEPKNWVKKNNDLRDHM